MPRRVGPWLFCFVSLYLHLYDSSYCVCFCRMKCCFLLNLCKWLLFMIYDVILYHMFIKLCFCAKFSLFNVIVLFKWQWLWFTNNWIFPFKLYCWLTPDSTTWALWLCVNVERLDIILLWRVGAMQGSIETPRLLIFFYIGKLYNCGICSALQVSRYIMNTHI